MITKLSLTVAVLALGIQASGQTLSRPSVPEKIKAPAGEQVLLKAQGSGSQIYVCQAGGDAQPAWTLKAPEAVLHDAQGAVIGKHYAGPTWQDNDGSTITGKAVERVIPSDLNSIPWLLVSVTSHTGQGVLSRVTTVQRINTQGGMAPAATSCDTSKLNVEVKVPYTADYYFYAPGK